MDLRSILATLRHHKTAALLIVLEVALTCAIIANAVHLIAHRLERIGTPSGMAEAELVRIEMTALGQRDDLHARTQRDLQALRQVPGVRAVTLSNQVPFGQSGWATGVQLDPKQHHETLRAGIYAASEGFIATAGLRLVAGRDFLPEEYTDWEYEGGQQRSVPVILLSRRTAQKLFPDGQALGRDIYVWDTPSRVVGIVDELALPRRIAGQAEQYAIVAPVRMTFDGGTFLLRTDAAQREAVRKAAVAALEREDPKRIVLKQDTFDQIRARHFQNDRVMTWLLVAVCVALLVIMALGIVGLASFWVQQRVRTIGIRRALGARRGHVLAWFQAENALLTALGVALGMAGAWGINLALMGRYEVPALPIAYLPVGALVLLVLGQLAVLGPARRAAALPPVVVMRQA